MIVLSQPVFRMAGMNTDNIPTKLPDISTTHYSIKEGPNFSIPSKTYSEKDAHYKWAYDHIHIPSIPAEHLKQNPHSFMGIKVKPDYSQPNKAYYEFDLGHTAPTTEDFLIRNFQQEVGEENGNLYPNGLSQQRANADTGVPIDEFRTIDKATTREEGLRELLSKLDNKFVETTKEEHDFKQQGKEPPDRVENQLEGIEKHRKKIRKALQIKPMSGGSGGGGDDDDDDDYNNDGHGGAGGKKKNSFFRTRGNGKPHNRAGNGGGKGPGGRPERYGGRAVDFPEETSSVETKTKVKQKPIQEVKPDVSSKQKPNVSQSNSDSESESETWVEGGKRMMSSLMDNVQHLLRSVNHLQDRMMEPSEWGRSERHEIKREAPAKPIRDQMLEQNFKLYHKKEKPVEQIKEAIQEVRDAEKELEKDLKKAVQLTKEMTRSPPKSPKGKGRKKSADSEDPTPEPSTSAGAPTARRTMTRATKLPAHLHDYIIPGDAGIPSRR